MDDQWVTIRDCSSLEEAEFLQSLLKANGIDSVIPDRNVAGLWLYTVAIGGVRVAVQENDVPRAEELLSVTPIPDELLESDELPEGNEDAARDD